MQPGMSDPLLIETAAGYILNQLLPPYDRTTGEALAIAEHKLGIALTPSQGQAAINAALDAMALASAAEVVGGQFDMAQLFPNLPEGTPVRVRFLIEWIDSQGRIIDARTRIMPAVVGGETVAQIQAQLQQEWGQEGDTMPTSMGAGLTPRIVLQPSLAFPA